MPCAINHGCVCALCGWKGAWLFIVYYLRFGVTRSVVEFINRYHLKQNEEFVPAGESALTPYFPSSLIQVLMKSGAEAFLGIYQQDTQSPDLTWNQSLRNRLQDTIDERIHHFRMKLTNHPQSLYNYTYTDIVSYPELEAELTIHDVNIKLFIENIDYKIDNPQEFMNYLVDAFITGEYKDNNLTAIIYAQVILQKRHSNLKEGLEYRGWKALISLLQQPFTAKRTVDYTQIEKASELCYLLLAAQNSSNTTLCINENGVQAIALLLQKLIPMVIYKNNNQKSLYFVRLNAECCWLEFCKTSCFVVVYRIPSLKLV